MTDKLRSYAFTVAFMGSAAVLIGALGFQYIGGMAPCKMCIWQRWPHGIMIALGALGLLIGPLRVHVASIGAFLMAVSGGLGVYHTGVERKWWAGPDSCTSGSIDGLTAQELMDKIMNAPMVRCDEVPWEMFALSMASWNAIASFGFMVLWIIAAKR
ncbi:MAG: disulfide bond formation protein B [Halocynthiibacter sp.]